MFGKQKWLWDLVAVRFIYILYIYIYIYIAFRIEVRKSFFVSRSCSRSSMRRGRHGYPPRVYLAETKLVLFPVPPLLEKSDWLSLLHRLLGIFYTPSIYYPCTDYPLPTALFPPDSSLRLFLSLFFSLILLPECHGSELVAKLAKQLPSRCVSVHLTLSRTYKSTDP